MMNLRIKGREIFLLGPAVFILLVSTSFAGIGDWTTYINMNDVKEIFLKGEELWCATTGGVVVLNTNNQTYTKLTNVQGLGGNQLYAVEIDSAGSFWFGAQNGTLTRYAPEENSWKTYDFIDRDGSRLGINDIAADGERLWVATNKALSLFLIYKHGGEIKETYRRLGEHMEEGEEVNCVRLVGGRVGVGTMSGVTTANKDDPNLLDFSRWISFTRETSPGLNNDSIYCITDVDGDIIVGTEQGVFRFESSDSSWQSLGLENLRINDLEYFDQKLHTATNAGIFVYQSQTWIPLPDSGLLSSNFNSLILDGEKTLWGGTAGKGISSLPSNSLSWRNHLIDGPPVNLFFDMEIDDAGNLWCTNEVYGASFFDNDKWTSLSSIPQLERHRINAVEKDKQGNIWFSSWGGGVMKYDPKDTSWLRYDETNSPLRGIADDPAYVVVNNIAIDEAGNRWFPVWDALDLSRVVCSPAEHETAWVVYHDQDGIKFPYLDNIFAQGGRLYICFRGTGLVEYNYNWTLEDKGDDETIHYTSVDHHLSDDAVRCANVDKEGTLWVGTSSGLDRFDPDYNRFRAVPLPDPLGPQVNAIVVDQRNNKWIATSNGLGMINSKGDFVQTYTTSNSKICADNVLGLKIDEKTGFMWVGTDNGLSRLETGIGAPAENLSDVIPFPNPFVIQSGEEMLTFDRLPYQATVRIFTIPGELIKRINSGNQWDGRNERGELVASGIYLFHVHGSSGQSAVGKIAVIRE